jgi:hypothetical protein
MTVKGGLPYRCTVRMRFPAALARETIRFRTPPSHRLSVGHRSSQRCVECASQLSDTSTTKPCARIALRTQVFLSLTKEEAPLRPDCYSRPLAPRSPRLQFQAILTEHLAELATERVVKSNTTRRLKDEARRS